MVAASKEQSIRSTAARWELLTRAAATTAEAEEEEAEAAEEDEDEEDEEDAEDAQEEEAEAPAAAGGSVAQHTSHPRRHCAGVKLRSPNCSPSCTRRHLRRISQIRAISSSCATPLRCAEHSVETLGTSARR